MVSFVWLSISISPFSGTAVSVLLELWPRTRRPLGINFRLSGLGVVAVWMNRDRLWRAVTRIGGGESNDCDDRIDSGELGG